MCDNTAMTKNNTYSLNEATCQGMIEQEERLIQIAANTGNHYPEDVANECRAMARESKSAREHAISGTDAAGHVRAVQQNWRNYSVLRVIEAFMEDKGVYSEEAALDAITRN